MKYDIPLDEVRTVDDLLGGEFVHTVPPDSEAFFEDDEPGYIAGEWKPRCREAEATIRKAIENILRSQTGLYAQNRQDAYVEVIYKLGKCLRRRYRGSGPHRITHKKFLKHPNRGGWLYLFARNTTLEWLGERIRVANGDERIKEALDTGVTPKATFTEYRTLKACDNEKLSFDLHQFAGKPGRGPDEMTLLSDYAAHREVEHQLSRGESEIVALIRQEVAELSPADREFFETYLDARYQGRTSAADRKRFQRLRTRIREAIMN